MKTSLFITSLLIVCTTLSAQNYAFDYLYPYPTSYYYEPQQPFDIRHKITASADMNNDGILDIVKSGADPNFASDTWIAIYYGTCKEGLNTVQDTFPLTGIMEATALELVDYDQDGKVDILVCGNEQLHYYRNTGGGLFAPVVISTYTTGLSWNKASMAIGDFNQDGFLDAYINVLEDGSGFACAAILMNGDATGNFTPDVNSYGCTPSTVAAYDVNNDGWKDVVLSTGQAYLSQPGGLSTNITSCFQGAGYIKDMFTILNSDTDANGEYYTAQNNILYYGEATAGSSPMASQYTFSSNIESFTVNDFDGDGFKDDIAVSLSTDSVLLLTNNSGIFTLNNKKYSLPSNTPIFSTDINGNGSPEIYIDNKVYRNSGGFRLSTYNDMLLRGNIITQTVADFDSDGYDDIAVHVQPTAPPYYRIAILYGSPCGVREIRDITCNVSGTLILKTAHINNDSIPDLVVSGATDSSVYVALNPGNGNFLTFTGYSFGGLIKNFDIADFNEDGYDDVFILTPSPARISLMTANSAGNGNLNAPSPLQNPWSINVACDDPVHADMNNDGHEDIIVSHSVSMGKRVSVIYGDGAGNFPSGQLASASIGSVSADYAVPFKLNDDNYNDLAIISGLNNEFGFSCYDSINAIYSGCYSNYTGFGLGTFEVGDMNNDSILDLVGNSSTSAEIYPLLFKPDYSFYVPTPSFPFEATNQSKIALLDFDGDGKKDISTINFETMRIYTNNMPTPPILQLINDTIIATPQRSSALNTVTAYEWFKNGVLQPGFTDNYFPSPTPGKYHLGVTYSSGAYVTNSITVLPVPVIEITRSKNGWNVFPNPAHRVVNISCNTLMQTVYLENLQGQKVKEFIPDKNVSTIDISQLPRGIYTLKAKIEDGLLVKKLVVY